MFEPQDFPCGAQKDRMHRFVTWLLIACCLAGCSTGTSRPQVPLLNEAAVPPDEYRLGTGDVISVRVYDWRASSTQAGEEDLKLERVRLDHSGTISLPFGQFRAVGQTIKQLEAAITESLRGRLLRNPRVWTNIEEYRPFFVEGLVGRPGAYPFQPGLTVRKAIAIGGGFRDRASSEKIFLVREGDSSNVRFRVTLNSPVGPGDTLTIEESFF